MAEKTVSDKNALPSKKGKKSIFLKELKNNKYLYLMFFPVLIWYILFAYVPMGGIVIAFQRYSVVKGIMGSKWVGLANFKTLFADPYFTRLLKNTLLINIYGIIFGFPLPIILAIAFNEIKNKRFKKITQTISYLPYFISVVVVCSMLIQFLSSEGLINGIITSLGGKPVYFLQQPKYFRLIYLASDIWQGVGFAAIIYLAALSGISQEQYEAATVDGANKFQKMKYITLPSLVPTIVMMFIIRLGSVMTIGHEKIILLYNPLTYETADVFNTYVYREGLVNLRYSYAQAVSLFQNVVGFIMVFAANKITRKLDGTSLW